MQQKKKNIYIYIPLRFLFQRNFVRIRFSLWCYPSPSFLHKTNTNVGKRRKKKKMIQPNKKNNNEKEEEKKKKLTRYQSQWFCSQSQWFGFAPSLSGFALSWMTGFSKTLCSRLSKSGSQVRSWEVGGIVDRRIGSQIVRSYTHITQERKDLELHYTRND